MLSRIRHIGLLQRVVEPLFRLRRQSVLASFLCAQASFAAPELATPPGAAPSREAALLSAINDYRAAQSLGRWQADPNLAAIAHEHSQAMASRQQLSHDGFTQRAARTGSNLCVENLLQGVVTPPQAVAAWLRSGTHRANLLDRDAARAGIGIAGPFVTLLACAAPVPSAPAPQRP